MRDEKLRVIITGATGMVGEGVLQECLQHPAVETVLILGRKPFGRTHPKLQEIVLPDLFALTQPQLRPESAQLRSQSAPPTAQPQPSAMPLQTELSGYNACFFCLGVSSVGMAASEYFRITYTLTLGIAQTLSRLNPDMVFSYVSGAGTDGTEKGRSRWARVKGKTENDLMKLPFRRVYAFRPGFIRPTPGLSNAHAFYKYINWLFPIGRALYPNGFVTNREIGLAMIRLALHPDSAFHPDGRLRPGSAVHPDSALYPDSTHIIDGKAIIRLAAAETASAAATSDKSPAT